MRRPLQTQTSEPREDDEFCEVRIVDTRGVRAREQAFGSAFARGFLGNTVVVGRRGRAQVQILIGPKTPGESPSDIRLLVWTEELAEALGHKLWLQLQGVEA